MAKGKGQINGWITKNGVHIPIYGTYTVRGGEEPKAKGSKFKRRKRPEEFDKDIRETESGKFMAQYSSDQGRKKGVKDIEKPFETREGARKFLTEENGEYEDAKFNKKAEAETYQKSGQLSKDLQTSNKALDEKWQEHSKQESSTSNTLANRNALKQQIDDYTRSHPNPTDEDRQKVSEMRNQYNQMMSEEKGRLKSINDEIKSNSKREAELDALKQEHYKLSKAMDNDSLLAPGSDRKLAELERKINERENGTKSTPTEPYAKSNNKYLGQSVKDLNKLDVRNLNDSELSQLREHASASSRTGARGADKLWKNADAEINRRAMEQESSTPTIHETRLQRQAVNEKAGLKSDRNQNFKTAYQNEGSSSFSPESSAKAINDMARRRANGGGKDDDWKTAQSVLESAPAGTTMIQTGNRGVKFQYTKKEDGKWHSSAGEDYTQDSKTLSMSWRGESGPSVEFTTPDKALSNADIKASHNAATGGRLNQALGLDRNNRPIGNRSTRKVDTSTPTRTEKQDSLSASMNERSRIRGELHAKDKAMKAAIPTTVSGLRSAYADATGSMKSKIAAELRRKGYSLVGGKWVKGRKE